jgi:hypothetical protein
MGVFDTLVDVVTGNDHSDDKRVAAAKARKKEAARQAAEREKARALQEKQKEAQAKQQVVINEQKAEAAQADAVRKRIRSGGKRTYLQFSDSGESGAATGLSQYLGGK